MTTNPMTVLGCCRALAIILTLPNAAVAELPEELFAEAETYTVRVQTRIEMALGDDGN